MNEKTEIKTDWYYEESEKYYNQYKILNGKGQVIVDGLYYEKLTREICDAHNAALIETYLQGVAS